MWLPPLHLPQRLKSDLGRHWKRRIKRRKKTWLLLMKEVQADSEVLAWVRVLLSWVTAKQSKAKRCTPPTTTGTEHSTPSDHKRLIRQTCRLSCPQKTPLLTVQNYLPRHRGHPRPPWPSSLLRTLPGGELGKHPPCILVTERNSTMETEQQIWELYRARRRYLKSWLQYCNI